MSGTRLADGGAVIRARHGFAVVFVVVTTGALAACDNGTEGQDASALSDGGRDPATDATVDTTASGDALAMDAGASNTAGDTKSSGVEALAVRAAGDEGHSGGLVSAGTLATWLANWTTGKPAGVDGDLIIFQSDAAAAPGAFIASGKGVRVFHATDLEGLLERRSNGVVAMGTVPANGLRIDNWLRKYNVRPNRDFVLFAAGTLTPANREALARAWLTLRYWGFDHGALGVLDPSVDSLPLAVRAPAGSLALYDGDTRITTTGNQNFALLADLGVLKDAGSQHALDVRPMPEHTGTVVSPSPTEDTCVSGKGNCQATFSGRVAGALHLPSRLLLQPTSTYQPLAEIDQALRSAGVTDGSVYVVYDNEADGSATVTFALLAIAGVPARWYAPGFVEWGSLNATHPINELRTLPATSPWRTDVFPQQSQGESTWTPAETAARPLVLDAFAPAANRVQESDRQYKQNPPALPGVGLGGNDCL